MAHSKVWDEPTEAWRSALLCYGSRMKKVSSSKKNKDLESLDDWYLHELPTLLYSREPDPYMEQKELSKLVKWKLTRGQWRPRLQQFVDQLSGEVVKEASRNAFRLLSKYDMREAIEAMASLKGVGPATSSAVLAAYRPDLLSFMSDEALIHAPGISKEYTLQMCLKLIDVMGRKCKELRKADPNTEWTVQMVEQAVWSFARAHVDEQPEAAESTSSAKAPKSTQGVKRKQRVRASVTEHPESISSRTAAQSSSSSAPRRRSVRSTAQPAVESKPVNRDNKRRRIVVEIDD
eukprot:GILK01010315.1.p1 GENE.GILK01010315.1~~GILK01010315.1.p1  ORF type:complete len:308 (-),score=33.19 GILK01010315.1:101-973(-)